MDECSDSESEGDDVDDLKSYRKKLSWLRKHKDFRHLISKEKGEGRGPSSKDKIYLKVNPDFKGTFIYVVSGESHALRASQVRSPHFHRDRAMPSHSGQSRIGKE